MSTTVARLPPTATTAATTSTTTKMPLLPRRNVGADRYRPAATLKSVSAAVLKQTWHVSPACRRRSSTPPADNDDDSRRRGCPGYYHSENALTSRKSSDSDSVSTSSSGNSYSTRVEGRVSPDRPEPSASRLDGDAPIAIPPGREWTTWKGSQSRVPRRPPVRKTASCEFPSGARPSGLVDWSKRSPRARRDYAADAKQAALRAAEEGSAVVWRNGRPDFDEHGRLKIWATFRGNLIGVSLKARHSSPSAAPRTLV